MKHFIPNISTFILILILFFMNEISTGETKVTTKVRCRIKLNSTKCSHGNLENTFDFSQIENTTQTLSIYCRHFNPINPFPTIDFNNVKYLTKLMILHCPSMGLNENVFLPLENLRTLRIINSSSTNNIFEQLKPLNSLLRLTLSQNKLETLQFEFRILTQLTILYLKSNHIENIRTNSFRDCYRLTEIDLSQNSISSLSNNNEFGNITNIFESRYLPNLKKLKLQHNKIGQVTCSMIPKTVEILNINSNFLKSFTCNEPHLTNHMLKEISADMIFSFNLEDCSFPPSIEYLSLRDANISRLPTKVFSPLIKLKTLRLEGNNIYIVDRFAFSSSNGLRSHLTIYINTCAYSFLMNSSPKRRQIHRLQVNRSLIQGIETVPVHKKHSTAVCQIIRKCYPKKYYYLNWYIYHNTEESVDVAAIITSDCGKLMLTEVPSTLPSKTLDLYMDGNNLTSVNLIQIQQTYPHLETLYLNNSNIHRIGIYGNFSGISLKFLHLENNFLTEFRTEKYTHLITKELHLENNNIEEVDVPTFTHSITKVYLENNKITKILQSFCWYEFIILYLDKNTITDVQLNCDTVIHPSFEKLFLRNNYLTVLKSFSFSSLQYLEELHLEGNQIQHIENNSFVDLPRLRKLYLQGNKLKAIRQEIFHIRANNIGENSSSHVDLFNNELIEMYLGGNSIEKINLSLFNVFPSLASLLLNNNRIREITWDRPLSLPSLKEIHLEENRLTILNGKEFKGLKNMKRLFLHHNELSSINKVTFQDMTSLEILTLHGNKLKRLAILQFGFSSNLKNLAIDQNPFSCDCKYLRKIFTTVNFISNISKIKCSSSENKKYLLEDYLIEFCDNKQLIIGLSISIGLLLLSVFISVLLYKHRLEIKVILYSRFRVRFLHDRLMDERKPFHAFIAYSCDDGEFVAQQLLPGLEEYHLCLHDRNFVVGAFVQENIVNAVNHSACTVIVFSRSFVKSPWCRFEFRTAHDKSLNKGCRPIIVIMLEDVKPDDMEEEMKVYVKTNTYLRWGDPLFWEKLYYALPAMNGSDNERNNQPSIPLQQFSC